MGHKLLHVWYKILKSRNLYIERKEINDKSSRKFSTRLFYSVNVKGPALLHPFNPTTPLLLKNTSLTYLYFHNSFIFTLTSIRAESVKSKEKLCYLWKISNTVKKTKGLWSKCLIQIVTKKAINKHIPWTEIYLQQSTDEISKSYMSPIEPPGFSTHGNHDHSIAPYAVDSSFLRL